MPTRWLKRLLSVVVVLAFVGLAVPVYMDYKTADYIVFNPSEASTSTVAMVLGASVIQGEPSPVLRERALGALELYRTGKVQKILVTGDDSVAGFDEVTPVREMLQAEGVLAEDIFLDHAGFDTYSSMYRARDVFEIKDVVVVTQAFHLPRAVFLARTLGLEAYGLAVPERGDPLTNDLREWGASHKAMFDLLMIRVPTYLGPHYPITGNGQETWK